MMKRRNGFTAGEARVLGLLLGIEWGTSLFDAEEFKAGLEVELEHGRRDPTTDVTHDDPILTAKIALAHLHELPDYYTRLSRMEAEGEDALSPA